MSWRGRTVAVVHTGRVERAGIVRVYLGAAAGVGTTYAMLDEAYRRSERGTDVLVGCIDTHDRPRTIDRLRLLVGDVATVPAHLDVSAILARRPDVVLVDDLAGTDADGRARWRSVEVLTAAGIDVIATLTVQHIESLSDPVRTIVGHAPTSTVPDEFLSRVEQIELVDITPEAIRRRIAHGNVFTAEALPAAEAELYNTRAFAELRALLMFWMADRLVAGPADPRGARETVVVAVTDSPTSDAVLRRAARLAHRSRARLVAVHVRPDAGGSTAGGSDAMRSDRQQRVEALGGRLYEIVDDDVGSALVSFATAEGATQLVLGGGPRRRFSRRTVVDRVLGASTDVDVHVVSTDAAPTSPGGWRGPVPLHRQVIAFALGAAALATMTVVLSAQRDDLSVSTSLALCLLIVVGVSAVGGAVPGITAAVVSPLIANWYLIPPYHSFRLNDGEHLLELFVFVSVAAIVSWFVAISARRANEAGRAQREAATLAALTGSGDLARPAVLVEHIRSTFDLVGVAVLSGSDDGPWTVVASAGDAPHDAESADLVLPLSGGAVVAARGGPLGTDDHRVLRAFTTQLARAFEQERLRRVAAESDALARADELRTAILRAASHDLRSPLASIKASVSSIRQPDVEWPPDVLDDFLESIESETDRLTAIVTNLLDLSRLEAGVLKPSLRAASLEEIVPAAVRGLEGADRLVVDIPAELPDVVTDPALLERVVANLVANALRFSDRPVRLSGHEVGGRIQIHVVDHGPGIPHDQRGVVVQPFHRLDDTSTGGGLGLGLAIVDRLVAAMGGSLDLRDTPGGGLSAVVTVSAAPSTSDRSIVAGVVTAPGAPDGAR